MLEQTTYWGVAVKQALLGASAFSVGVLLYRTMFHERRRHRPFLAMGFIGVATTLLLVGERVAQLPLVPPTIRAWLYLAALVLIAVGFLGDAIRSRKREAARRSGDDRA